MQIPIYKKGKILSRKQSAFIGENFLMILMYTILIFIYAAMFVTMITKRQDPLIGAGFQGSSGITDFGYGVNLVSELVSAVLVLGWLLMSIFKRPMVIGRYHVHPKTNILVEIMFLGSNICLLASDRLFINMLPSQVDIGTIIYPLALSIVVATSLMIIYLFGKLVSKFMCRQEPIETPEERRIRLEREEMRRREQIRQQRLQERERNENEGDNIEEEGLAYMENFIQQEEQAEEDRRRRRMREIQEQENRERERVRLEQERERQRLEQMERDRLRMIQERENRERERIRREQEAIETERKRLEQIERDRLRMIQEQEDRERERIRREQEAIETERRRVDQERRQRGEERRLNRLQNRKRNQDESDTIHEEGIGYIEGHIDEYDYSARVKVATGVRDNLSKAIVGATGKEERTLRKMRDFANSALAAVQRRDYVSAEKYNERIKRVNDRAKGIVNTDKTNPTGVHDDWKSDSDGELEYL